MLVVYPIAKPDQSRHLYEFLTATFNRSGTEVTKTPFPVVLDIGLKAVDALGIRKDLSKPATYILDKLGQVRFAHVGNSLSDRPTIKVILKQLDTRSRGIGLKIEADDRTARRCTSGDGFSRSRAVFVSGRCDGG